MTLHEKFLDALNMENRDRLKNEKHPNKSTHFDLEKTNNGSNKDEDLSSDNNLMPETQIPEPSSELDEEQSFDLIEDSVESCGCQQVFHMKEPETEIIGNTLSFENNLTDSPNIEEKKFVQFTCDKDISINNSSENKDLDDEILPYQSPRLFIRGLHIQFIDIAREIVQQNSVSIIPLMREYHISENELQGIIAQIQEAKILDSDQNVQMKSDEFEKFIDIYEPSLFDCIHTVFDKDIFLCIGEIIFDKGVANVYDCLPADEIIDYLNIMENLKIIAYDKFTNQYDILVDKEKFYTICECIPASFSNSNYEKIETDYKNVNFDDLSGAEFERYCAYILTNYGYKNIKITPSTGDHGIDILAEKDDITYAIQCKCYSDNVGNAAIQQAHTGKSLYHKDIAVVMTNRYFTSQAIEEAKTLGVKLWDRDKLNEMIDGTQSTV